MIIEERERRQSNVAWFKLAQFVSRREKEKALGLYKLLSYSFDDKAFSLQVEGDILWAFNDERGAIMKYKQAAFLYQKERKIVSAVALYEHLLTLEPENFNFLAMAIECYARLDWSERLQERFNFLLKWLEKDKVNSDQVLHVIKNVVEWFVKENKKNSLEKFKEFIAEKHGHMRDKAVSYFKA